MVQMCVRARANVKRLGSSATAVDPSFWAIHGTTVKHDEETPELHILLLIPHIYAAPAGTASNDWALNKCT